VRRTARLSDRYRARMSLRVTVFRVIGLAGCAAAGYGIHGLLSLAQCSASVTVCQVPDGAAGGYVAPLVIGIITAVVGIIGGGFIVFGGLFAGIGVGAIVAGLQVPSGEFGHGFGLIFGGCFTAVGLLAALGASWAGAIGRRRALLLSTGVRGVGVVVDVQDTGVTINDNPSVRLTLDVTPSDETPPFRTTVRHTVSRVHVPRPGDRLAVVLDPADRSRVLLDDSASAALAALATSPPVATGWGAAAPPYPAPTLPAPTSPAPAYGTPDGGPAAPSLLGELERLAGLHASGALTDEEFAQFKGRLLAP